MKQTIELRKLRDFGQVINDTFTFFKENFKPLLRSLFVICGVFMLIGTVSTSAYYLNISSMINVDPGSANAFSNYTVSTIITALVNAFILVISQACIHLVTLCYISVYLQNKTQPSLIEVWGFFKYYFWRVLGSAILLVFITAIGYVFCIIPGIYFTGVFSLVIPIIVMENASFGYAFNKSFRLIRENWWFVFGVIFVVGLMVGVANGLATWPLSIISVMSKMLTVKTFVLPLIIIFSLLQSLMMIFHSLTSISVSLCYFDLSEQKEGTGILDRIENFGKTNNDENPATPAEEY
jgi:hypothetical protein